MSLREAAIAANRFGLGATPGLLDEIKSDPRGWLKSQLDRDLPFPPQVAAMPPTGARMIEFPIIRDQSGRVIMGATNAGRRGGPAGDLTLEQRAEMLRNLSPEERARIRERVQAARDNAGGGQSGPMGNAPAGMAMGAGNAEGGDMAGDAGSGQAMSRRPPVFTAQVKQRFDVAVQSPTPFRERLVHFWSNHFVVSAAKPTAQAMPGTFERDVARAHVVANFEGMLVESSKHPAMQFYLDNFVSIGPNSVWGQNPELPPMVSNVHGRPDGLNENLAREILELHTVGVNGGYTQEDVTNFAKAITGWGVDFFRRDKPGFAPFQSLSAAEIFHFNPDAHEPGPQVVMGKTYDQPGVEQGEAILHDLARHPETANFIAFKLARYFIADTPPPAAVDRIARVFLDSEGDLPAIYEALIDSPEAWEEDRRKMKQPEEFLISAVRAIGGPDMPAREVTGVLEQMGQSTYNQPGPDGWADTADYWTGADSLWKRLEWAMYAAEQTSSSAMDPAELVRDVLGPDVSSTTVREIGGAESPAQAKALMLLSAEFLRR